MVDRHQNFGPAQPPTPPPGMYPDPDGSGYRRWWDGRQWHPVQYPAHVGSTGNPAAAWVKGHPKASGGIVAGVLVLALIGAVGGAQSSPAPDTASDNRGSLSQTDDGGDEDADATDALADTELAPVDTDGDGVNDDEDYRPDDPDVRTADDVDSDGDGVPDYQDAFPNDPKYSVDSDGDGVADKLDAFPNDERYSKDSDGDGVADAEDDFPADPTRSAITPAMRNAIDSAQSYLDFAAFSRSGLIEQLEYEDYETGDATFAVDYLGIDWKEQARKSAKSYLGFSSFSRQGLIEQLQYEGFSLKEATYGVDRAY